MCYYMLGIVLDIYSSDFPLWHYWQFGLYNSLLWSCPVFWRRLSSIPGPYPPDANGIPHPLPCHDDQKCLQTLPNASWEGHPTPHSLLRITDVHILTHLISTITPWTGHCYFPPVNVKNIEAQSSNLPEDTYVLVEDEPGQR